MVANNFSADRLNILTLIQKGKLDLERLKCVPNFPSLVSICIHLHVRHTINLLHC